MFRDHATSLALAILALGCSGESSTGPSGFEATVRVSGVVVWIDCRPAVGVSVVLDHFYCDASRSIEFDLGCDRKIYGSDLTDADGRYEIEATVGCPRYLTVQARAGSEGRSAMEEVDCGPGDQKFDLVIGTKAPDAVCHPDLNRR